MTAKDPETKAKSRSPEPAGKAAASAEASEQRRLVGRANVLVASVLLVLITLMINYLAFRHYRRWDWTSEGMFTLSARTQQLLHGLSSDIDVYLVLSSGESNYQDLRELLERYRAESQHVVLHYVDPDREPTEYTLIAERFDLARAQLADGSQVADVAVVIANGERVWKITRDDLVAIDFDPSGDAEGNAHVDVRSEQALSGGIVEVTSGRATHVCVTEGHGEWTLDHQGERDLGGLRDEMRRENLEIETIQTRGLTHMPETCDAVFVIGPTQAFAQDEAALLRSYLEGGGRAFLALDPELDRGEVRATGLESMLRELGVRVDRTVVLEMDERHLLPPGSPSGPFLVDDYGTHPITAAFESLHIPMAVSVVRSVRPTDDGDAAMLLQTTEHAFAETDIARLVETMEPHRDDQDIAGPVSLGVAREITHVAQEGEHVDAEHPARNGRLVVMGDSDFLASELIARSEVLNYELASAILGWLTERQSLIEVPARRMSARPVQLTENDVFDLGFRVIVLLPLASVFLGIAVWWNRRS